MLRVFALVAACQHYPDTLDYRKQFEAIIRAWRPGPTGPSIGQGTGISSPVIDAGTRRRAGW